MSRCRSYFLGFLQPLVDAIKNLKSAEKVTCRFGYFFGRKTQLVDKVLSRQFIKVVGFIVQHNKLRSSLAVLLPLIRSLCTTLLRASVDRSILLLGCSY